MVFKHLVRYRNGRRLVQNLANALPFAHAVNAARDAISGNYSDIMPELIPVCGYAVVLLVLAVVVFSVMMKRNK